MRAFLLHLPGIAQRGLSIDAAFLSLSFCESLIFALLQMSPLISQAVRHALPLPAMPPLPHDGKRRSHCHDDSAFPSARQRELHESTPATTTPCAKDVATKTRDGAAAPNPPMRGYRVCHYFSRSIIDALPARRRRATRWYGEALIARVPVMRGAAAPAPGGADKEAWKCRQPRCYHDDIPPDSRR